MPRLFSSASPMGAPTEVPGWCPQTAREDSDSSRLRDWCRDQCAISIADSSAPRRSPTLRPPPIPTPTCSCSYDPNGNNRLAQFPNGTREERTYTNLDWLQQIQLYDAGSTLRDQFTYSYGNAGHLREQVTGQLMRIQVVFQQPEQQELPPMFAQHLDPATGENEFDMPQGAGFGAGSSLGFAAAAAPTSPVEARDPNDPSSWGRVGRNEPCPCGSGKKFKHCHGQLVSEA